MLVLCLYTVKLKGRNSVLLQKIGSFANLTIIMPMFDNHNDNHNDNQRNS